MLKIAYLLLALSTSQIKGTHMRDEKGEVHGATSKQHNNAKHGFPFEVELVDDSNSQQPSSTSSDLVDQCKRFRNIQIGSYDANQQEIVLGVNRLSRANCSEPNTDAASQMTSDSFISLINNYGQGQWEIKVEAENANSRFTSFASDSSVFVVESDSVNTLNILQLNKATGELVNAQDMSLFDDASALFGVSVVKAQEQDKYYIAATKVESEDIQKYTNYLCEVTSDLTVNSCSTITSPVSSTPTTVTSIGFTDSSRILVLESEVEQLHQKTIVSTLNDQVQSTLSIKYSAEVANSQFVISQDGKKWATLDNGIETLWISHGTIEGSTMKLVAQTKVNVKAFNAKVFFVPKMEDELVITMFMLEEQQIAVMTYNMIENKIAKAGLIKSSVDSSNLNYAAFLSKFGLVIGYQTEQNQKIVFDNLNHKNAMEKVEIMELSTISQVDVTSDVEIISICEQDIYLTKVQEILTKKITKQVTLSNQFNYNQLSSEKISAVKSRRNLVAMTAACLQKLNEFYTKPFEFEIGQTGDNTEVSWVDGSPSFSSCNINIYFYNYGQTEFIDYWSDSSVSPGYDKTTFLVEKNNVPIMPGIYPVQVEFGYNDAGTWSYWYKVQYVRAKIPSSQLITTNVYQESCSNRATYPKVIGWESASSQIYGSDVSTVNPNIIGICGVIDPKALTNVQIYQDRRRGLISQTNPSGSFEWTYTVTALNYNPAFFTSCVYRTYTGVEMLSGLLHLPQSQQNSLVQFESATGKLLQATIVPGTFQTSIYYNKLYRGSTPIDLLVTGMRTDDKSLGLVSFQADKEFSQRGFISAHKINGNTQTFAIHDVVSTSRTNIYTAYIETNNGNNAFQVLYHQTASTGAQVTAPSISQIDYPASIGSIDQVRYSLVVDANNYLLYWSSGNYHASNSSIVKTLRKFDVFDEGNSYDIFDFLGSRTYVVSISNGFFISDIQLQNGQLYEQFTVSESRYYIVLYGTDLSIKAIKSFYNANFEITQLNILPTGTSAFFTTLTTKHPINDIYYSTVVDRFDNDITRGNTDCLYWNSVTDILSSSLQTTNGGASQSLSSVTYSFSANQLTPFGNYEAFYFEQKQDTLDIYYRPVTGCTLKGLNQLKQQLPEQTFFLSANQQFKFAVEKPQICSADSLTSVVSVSNFASVPSFIMSSSNSTHMIFDLSTASALDTGIYTIVITYTVGSITKAQTVSVNIYPAQTYGANVPNIECSNIGTQQYYAPSSNKIYKGFSMSEDGETYLVCGSYSISTTYYTFIHQMTKGNAILFQQEQTYTTNSAEALDCGYHGKNDIYFVTRSELVSSNTIYDRMNLIHMDNNATLLRTRTLQPQPGQGFDARVLEIVPSRNLIFIAGQTKSQALGFNTESTWVMMINSVDLNIMFMRVANVLDLPNNLPYVLRTKTLTYDQDNSKLFITTTAINSDYGLGAWSTALIDDTNGDLVWNKNLYDPTVSTVFAPYANLEYVGATYHSNVYYGCFVNVVAPTYQAEVQLTSFGTDGTVIDTYETQLTNTRQIGSCTISKNLAQGKILLGVSDSQTTSEYLVFVFQTANGVLTPYTFSALTQKFSNQRFVNYIKLDYQANKLNVFQYVYSPVFGNAGFRSIAQNFDSLSFNWQGELCNRDKTSSQLSTVKTGLGTSLQSYWNNDALIASKKIDSYAMNQKFTTLRGVKALTNNYEVSKDFRSQYSTCSYIDAPIAQVQTDYLGNSAFKVQKDLYTLNLKKSQQCQNYELTDTLKYTNGDDLYKFMTYNTVDRTLKIDADNNTFDKIYNMIMSTSVNAIPSLTDSKTFQIEVERNYPPVITTLSAADATVQIYNDELRKWTITKASDDMRDLSIWNLDVSKLQADGSTYTSINSTVNWLHVTQYSDSSYSFQVQYTPVPITSHDQYRIRVYVSDDMQNDPLERYTDIILQVVENKRPNIKGTVSYDPFQTIRIIQSFDYTIDLAKFSDVEGDKILFTLTGIYAPTGAPADALDWISQSINADTQEIHVWGETPRDNSYAGKYRFEVELTDPQGGPTRTVNFYLQVNVNNQVQTTTIADENDYIRAKTKQWTLSNYCSDPDGDVLRYQLFINGTDYFTRDYSSPTYSLSYYFQYSNSTRQLTFDFQQWTQGGTHSIAFQCFDYVNQPVWTNFTIYAKHNFYIKNIAQIPNRALLYKKQQQQWTLSNYFQDPESRTISYTLFKGDGVTAVDGVFKNAANIAYTGISSGILTLSFRSATEASVGVYNFVVKATDDVGQVTTQSFSFEILNCYPGCLTCDETDFNQCNTCRNNFYFLNRQCVSECGSGLFENTINNQCELCPSECSLCTGSDRTSECQACKPGFYHSPSEGGCFKTCPVGYYPDPQDWTCKLIPITNTKYQECLTIVNLAQATQVDRVPEDLDEAFQPGAGTCEQMDTCTGGVVQGGVCKWMRKFNVQCSLNYKTGTPTIIVSTNSMPDHCFATPNSQFPAEKMVQFEVAFDIAGSKLKNLNYNTQKLVDSTLCANDWTNDNNFRAIYEYTGYNTNSNGIVGIAMNGVPIYTGTSELKYDAFYPKGYSLYKNPKIVNADLCMGAISTSGFYKYYAYSPCIYNYGLKSETSETKGLCADGALCSTDLQGYISSANLDTSNGENLNKPLIVGIARDGHLIVGPHKEDGVYWQPCDLDMCNGYYDDETDTYVYVMTMFHPYTIGCFGPANDRQYTPSCTTNAKVCVATPDKSSFAANMLYGYVQIIASLIALLGIALM